MIDQLRAFFASRQNGPFEEKETAHRAKAKIIDRTRNELGVGGHYEHWVEREAKAINERRAWIKVNGAPLSDLQVLEIHDELRKDRS